MKNIKDFVIVFLIVFSGANTLANTTFSSLIASGLPATMVQPTDTFYASPSGSGSVCSLGAPCSLDGVRDKIRSVNDSMTNDIVVNLMGGIYSLTSPFELNPQDSASNGYNIIYQAYDTLNPPVFSGGHKVTGWTLHDQDKNIYKAYAGSGEFRQLFVNGIMAERARIPNKYNHEDCGTYYTGITVNKTNNTVTVPNNYVSHWERMKQIELVMNPHWYHHRILIDTFTVDGDYTTLKAITPPTGVIFNKPDSWYNVAFYYFENAYEFLDVEGEWYLNTEIDTLYYIPRQNEDLTNAEVMVPNTAENLMTIIGTESNPVQNIHVNGVRFEYTNWLYPSRYGVSMTQGNSITSYEFGIPEAAVKVEYANKLMFKKNVFGKLGGVGINFGIGVKNSKIIGNVFYDLASNGINLGTNEKNAPENDKTSYLQLANNFITRVGRNYTNAQGIYAAYVSDISIEHNEISLAGYTGMQIGQQSGGNIDVGMKDNIIRYNHVHHVMQIHDDGAGVYTLARQPGTLIFENWLHHIKRSPYAASAPVAGVYLDNYSEYITVKRNVLHDNTDYVRQNTGQGARNNTIENNDIQDQSVKDNAGLVAAYSDIKNNVPPLSSLAPPPPPPALSGDTIETEDMDLIGATIESSTFYHNGKGVKPLSGTGQASFSFADSDGNYDITVAYIEEDDGQARHKLYINDVEVDAWTATKTSGGFNRNTRSIQNVGLNNGDVVKITGTVNQGSHGRMDYIAFTEVIQDTNRIEAENMTLVNASVESGGFYHNGEGAKPSAPAGTTGEASFTFDGVSGQYNITVAYIQEDDGQAQHKLFVNGTEKGSWTAELSSAGFQFNTHNIDNITINNGDTLKITGKVTGGSHGRMDYLEYHHLVPVRDTIEAENMTLSNATIEHNTFFHNGVGVKPSTPAGTTGEASFTFDGASGQYEITVAYIKEDDGQAQHKLFVDGTEKDSWTAALSGSGFEPETHTISDITINNGDVLKITGKVTGGSHGRMDYLVLNPLIPALDTFEAENMTLSNATVELNTFYHNGEGVKPSTPAGTTGEASFTFDGVSGQYDITVGYIKEDDGQAQHKLFVNETEKGSWTAALSGSGFEFDTHTVEDITVNNGDVIKITGKVTGGSHGRMDYLVCSPVALKSAEIITTSQQQKLDKDLLVYPNPVDKEVVFEFSLEKACRGDLSIYDLTGRKVLKTISRSLTPGINRIQLDIGKIDPLHEKNICIFKLHTKEFTKTGKLIITGN